jgi:O-antigen/teichoic acid export membrane protein
MNFNRTKNAKRNILFGLINKVVSIALPFILRTAMIQILGAEYLGLNSLFSSVLQVLNLAELGFSEAIVYSVYKPIANNDIEKVCALLKYFKKIYTTIGFIVLGVGIILLPFLPHLINGSYPANANLYILFLIYLLNTVLTYWLFAYKTSLLQAFQRNDVVSKIDTLIKIILNAAQLVVLLLFQNYYIYLIVMPICTIANNLLTSYYVDKHFPEYRCSGVVDDDTKKTIKFNVVGLSISKMCATTRNSLDSIFVSAFLGLTVTAIYNNYYYIMNAVTLILSIVIQSLSSVVGNTIATESPHKNYDDMNKLNFIYMWISGWATCCLFCLYQPFMLAWVGKKYLFDMFTVSMFCAYFYALKMGDIRTIYVQGAGLYWQQRYRALGESLANIALNWILGKFFGATGIVAATLISLFVFNFILSTQIIFKYYFKDISVREYYLNNIKFAFATIAGLIVTCFFCSSLHVSNIYIELIVRLLLCIVIPNLIWIAIFNRTKYYQNSVKWILDKLNKKSLAKLLLVK